MSSFRARAVPVCAAAIVAAAVLTGCASSRLSAQVPPGVRLAGDWKLDPARSDDLGKAVDQLRTQREKDRHDKAGEQHQGSGHYSGRGRRGGGESGGQQPGGAGRGESSSGPGSGEPGVGAGLSPRVSPVDELMSSVPRGDYLRITVSSGAFTVISGDSSEEYTPGLESEISAQQGDAQQISGWKGVDYVIDTRPQWGPEIIQSYGLTKDGKLSVTVRLTGRGTRLTFTRLYDRTTRMAPLAPPTIN
jgi:outer membrane murein-binding lipoprotein Lpp